MMNKKMESNFSLFPKLHPEESALILKYVTMMHFHAGEVIVTQGKKSKGLYVIEQGRVAVSVRLPGDVPKRIALLSLLDFFGETAFLDGGPSTASVIALEDTSCYFLSEEYCAMFKVGYRKIAYKITLSIAKAYCERLRNINDIVGGGLSDTQRVIIGKLKKPSRLPSIYLLEKDLSFLKGLPIFNQLTDEDIIKVFPYLKCSAYKKYDIIFEEGDESTACYFVIQGAVQIVVTRENTVSKLGVLGPGSLFGYLSLIDRAPRSATSYVRESAIILRADLNKIAKLQSDDPELYYKCFIAASGSLAELLRRADKLLLRLAVESRF
jgi:CRP-like cAMP-binding protein